MSLNCLEIDRVLSELDLRGAKIQRVLQPSYDSLVLGLYAGGRAFDFLISIAHGATRIHSLSSSPPKPERPLRFMECIKSRIKGGIVESAIQLGTERIVRFELSVPRRPDGADIEAPSEILHYRLYVRLWSGAGNIILCEDDGEIVDVIARRPKRNEVSGGHCAIEKELSETKAALEVEAARKEATGEAQKPVRLFSVREFPAIEGKPEGGNFNDRVEAWYASQGGELSREKLLEYARERFAKRERILTARIAELEARAAEYREGNRLKELGDILMANPGLSHEKRFMLCEDFYRGGEVSISIDPLKTVVQNALVYYERAKKAASGLSELEAELASTKLSLEDAVAGLARLERTKEPLLIARALKKGGTARTSKDRGSPGLSLERSGWRILVGRSAKENDELLRRYIRGSDYWFHARDYAGSYVFVKARAGKSLPLEILLDAGNLAIYYSKARSSGEGDLYYTQAKYLRRAKDGPKGLVIPMQEKNLHVCLDEKKLKELRTLMGDTEDKA